MKLTIILTVYNKEPFLRKALDSLLNQQGNQDGEYEILAVNDGSTDGSFAILEDYSRHNRRVRVITQENQGLSVARNIGVEGAQGDYVWFVDADDTISNRSVKLICDATVSRPDVIPIYAITDGIDRVRNTITPTLHSGREILADGYWQHCGVFWVFRKEFLLKNNLCFFPGIYHEDAEFTPRMLYMAKTAVVLPEVLYIVYRNPNSITQIPHPKRAFDCLIVAERLLSFFDQQRDMTTTIRRVMDNRIAMIINDALFVISRNPKEEQRRFDEKLLSMPDLMRPLKDSNIRKYRIEGFLFCLFPGHYTTMYKLMKLFGK